MVDFVKWRYAFFAFSLAIIVPGVISLILFGLNLGIDFTGGTLWQVSFERPVNIHQVRAVLIQEGYQNPFVQSFSPRGRAPQGEMTNGVSMRLPPIKQGSSEQKKIASALEQRFGPYKEYQYQDIGPSVGTEIENRAIIAVGVAALGILLYIAFAFRKVDHPWRYGICAIVAMLHDVLIVVGIFSILGHFFGTEVDALFVTALLTVIGFSVHDTIVVFDRIRENQLKKLGERFDRIVNYSLIQTLVRSVNTSMTVLITLAALYFFGGVTVRDFVLALLIGIFSGTYSSIFNASLLLVVWENGELTGGLRRLFGSRQEAAAA